MLKIIRTSLVLLAALTLLTGLAYPLAMTAVSQALFPAQAEGSLVRDGEGKVVGSLLIGQAFASDRYFHGRPSATTAADPADPGKTVAAPYNAAASAGSNLGPTNQALVDRVRQDLEGLKAEHPGQPVPMDLVTTSASGLDPHVSPEAARFQVPRVAKARGLPEARLLALIEQQTELPAAGLVGEPRVNVLALNLALDSAKP